MKSPVIALAAYLALIAASPSEAARDGENVTISSLSIGATGNFIFIRVEGTLTGSSC